MDRSGGSRLREDRPARTTPASPTIDARHNSFLCHSSPPYRHSRLGDTPPTRTHPHRRARGHNPKRRCTVHRPHWLPMARTYALPYSSRPHSPAEASPDTTYRQVEDPQHQGSLLLRRPSCHHRLPCLPCLNTKMANQECNRRRDHKVDEASKH